MAGVNKLLTAHRGYVVNTDGSPVPAAMIVFVESSVVMPEIALLADDDGQFIVRLPAGSFTLRAYGPAGETGEASLVVDPPRAEEITIVVGGAQS